MKKIKRKIFDKKLLFYCCLIALPLIQYSIFYIYVNINSFVLAFTNVDAVGNTSSAGFSNFVRVWNALFNNGETAENKIYAVYFSNAVIDYLVKTIVGTGGALFFSYYIYKKQLFGGFFKVILFLPQIIPGIAFISIYKLGLNNCISPMLGSMGVDIDVLISANSPVVYEMVLFYSLFVSFGTQTMMYLGAMNKINPSITEAGQLDGVTFIREFVSITVPCIFSTIGTFIVVGLTGIFASDFGLYSFFQGAAPIKTRTIGYYIIKLTRDNTDNQVLWPYISTLGLYFTLVVAPVTLCLKRLLDKLDPTK